MKIRSITLYKLSIPLRKPFVISLGKLEAAENLLVKITTEEGLVGFGECSPFRTIHGESVHTCFETGREIAKLLLENKSWNPDTALALMDRFIFANHSVKSAFDIALYDLAAQMAGQPLYVFLGGKKKKILHTDYTVSLGPVDEMVEAAMQIQEDGFCAIKLKLGEHAERDLERVERIREAVGPALPLRLDANQGWSREDAGQVLAALGELNVEHCEEPISRKDFIYLHELRKISPVPIMADESCFVPEDIKRLVEFAACDAINIKLGKSSGLYNALQMLRLAEKHSLSVQLGGFLESRLGFSAAAHLAMCSDKIRFIDFDTPLMFAEDPVSGGIIYEAGGLIRLPDGNGLGAVVDDAFLASLPKLEIKA